MLRWHTPTVNGRNIAYYYSRFYLDLGLSPLQAPLASSYTNYVAGPVVQCEVEGTQENVEGIKSVIFKLHEYYGCECTLGWGLWGVVEPADG